ncbi:fatty acid desaturase family protein [Nocardioides ochotonae]|uniref:fatty acid desaturase family protein n=1 Tax=Nocardioides ochotonae TaxID=2685869 RepID=UPI00140B5BC0|nr:acyl-CoA desaturase [Nocardioides ochotonae]
MTTTTHLQPSRIGPAAHLTADDVEALGREITQIRQEVLDSRGARDAAYIRRVIAAQRALELSGRAVLVLASNRRGGWVLGTAMLGVAKSLENMEIGHNVLHGQWDWMRDPKIHSTTWDWDHASPPEQWKRAHNETHHTYTNILGKDNDLGYGIMRVDEAQPWKPRYLVQPLWNAINALIFEYGIAMYDLDFGDSLRNKTGFSAEKKAEIRTTLRKIGKQATKDYVVLPALSGRHWRATLTATVTANVLRNVWSHSVIMCGHFPEGVEAFEMEQLDPDETRGEWYLRQMLGSANISGPPLVHLMTGNLSHQIEHHVFPDLPSNRYAEIAPRMRDLFERYGLSYNVRPLPQQVASAWHKVVRLSLPNGWLQRTGRHNWRAQLRELRRSEPSPTSPV